jgi:hypothetical protein
LVIVSCSNTVSPSTHDLGVGGQHAGRQRGRLAPVGLPDQAHVGQSERVNEIRCAVGGPVVDYDDFEVGVVCVRQGAHGALDPDGLVVRRHDHGDRRLEARGWLCPRAADLYPCKHQDDQDARGDKEADRDDDPAQRAGHPERQLDGPQKRGAASAFEPRGCRLRLRAREAEQVAQRDE